MSDITLILLCAGNSTRFNKGVKKQWLRIDDKPLWLFVAQNFTQKQAFAHVIIVASPEDIHYMHNFCTPYTIISGGASRQASLQNALLHVDTPYVLVSDVARACIPETLLKDIIAMKETADSIVPFLPVTDTIVYKNETINREDVKRIQTPQLSKTKVLQKTLNTDGEFTDESSAIVAAGGTRAFIMGDEHAHKITYYADLEKISCLQPPSKKVLCGNGFDVHAFGTQGDMYLCGVHVSSEYGFIAHSDGDVAIHALIDALLGAAGMGDIGTLFPDNDTQYAGIDSKELLSKVVTKLHSFGFVIGNVDITIAAQKPKIAPFKEAMRQTLAKILQIEPIHVNVKATTTERLGFIGRSEGVGVWANANLYYFNWKMKEK